MSEIMQPTPEWVRAGLYKVRKDLGVTQDELARQIGKTQGEVSRIMLGRSARMRPRTLQPFIEFLKGFGIFEDTPLPAPPPPIYRGRKRAKRKKAKKPGNPSPANNPRGGQGVRAKVVGTPEEALKRAIQDQVMELEILRFQGRALQVVQEAKAGKVSLLHLKKMLRSHTPEEGGES